MAAQERKPGSPLAERLFAEFYRFSFFQAVHLLEAFSPEKKPIGEALTPREEPVRFSVKPGLAFPPSEVADVARVDDGAPIMQVAFMGLIGPSGVLPYWYNEHAVERLREKDSAFTAFLDIFHHRLISLFYRSWKKYRCSENYGGADDRLSRCLLSLIGLGTPGFPLTTRLPADPLIFYSGMLSRRIPSAVAVEATVAYFAGTKAVIDQFLERVIPLDPDDVTRLGAANSELGINTVCGSFTRDCRNSFRINLGPMEFTRFNRFLPSGGMLRPVFSLVRYIVGVEYEFEVRIHLKREEVPPCVIGGPGPASVRLGWTTWLKAPAAAYDVDPYVTFQESDAK